MSTNITDMTLNSVFVITSDEERNPRDWAVLCVDQILRVADSLPEPLRSQALGFKHEMADVVTNYIAIAIEADRLVRE